METFEQLALDIDPRDAGDGFLPFRPSLPLKARLHAAADPLMSLLGILRILPSDNLGRMVELFESAYGINDRPDLETSSRTWGLSTEQAEEIIARAWVDLRIARCRIANPAALRSALREMDELRKATGCALTLSPCAPSQAATEAILDRIEGTKSKRALASLKQTCRAARRRRPCASRHP